MIGTRAARATGLAAAAVACLAATVAAQATGASQGVETAVRDTPAHLVVRVVDPSGGAIPGARARMFDEPSHRGRKETAGPEEPSGTGSPLAMVVPGRFEATATTPGRRRLLVTAPGYRTWERAVDLTPGDSLALVARLDPAPFRLEELIARVRRGTGDPLPAGHSVDRIDFGAERVTPTGLEAWLQGLPGTQLRRRGGGGPQVLAVRGSRPEGVLVLLDGLPLNDPLTGVADLSGIPAATLESATLVRGSVPEAGPGALGGVLFLRSRDAAGTSASMGLEAGSFGHRAADLHLGAEGGAGAFSLTGRYEESRNDFRYRNRIRPGEPMERRVNADTRGWHGTLAARPGRLPVSLRLRTDHVSGGAPGRMGTTLFDAARREDRSWRVALDLAPTGRVTGSAALGRHVLAYRDPRLDQETRHGFTDARLRVVARPRPGSRWEALGRLAVERASGDRLSGAPTRSAVSLTVARRLGGEKVELRPALTVDAGVGDLLASPSLAVSVRPAPRSRLWGRAGSAVRRPTFSDLYFASARFLRPNPELRAERIDLELELGAEWTTVDGRLRARGAAFARRTRDPIAWLPSSVAVWSPRNLERLSTRGLEAEVEIEPLSGWGLEFSGTATASRLGSGSGANPLPYAPAIQARGALERAGRWIVARLETRLVGPRTTSLAGTHRLPTLALLDLRTRASFAADGVPLALELGVRNVLDARYELTQLFPEPGRSLEARVAFGPFGDEP